MSRRQADCGSGRTTALLAMLAVTGFGIGTAAAQTSSSGGTAAPAKTPFETAVSGLTKVEGLWTMYHSDQKLLVELKASDLGRNYIVVTSIARGISSGMVLGGMSWGFGDDALWTFEKSGTKIHVVRRNVRFTAASGSPEADAVKVAYSDSVLYALPVVATGPSGGSLVDMSRIFFSDDQEIGRAIGAASFASDRSTWAKVKAFPSNVELQVAAVYSSSRPLDTVSDPRGMRVNVHYSISLLPSTGYKPRLADDRVGYFLTVLKDFTNTDDDQHFVRYVNRWDLQKADPKASLSPPKEPIVFHLEKTVPIRLRPIVRAGIEEWNKAFEKLGFADAIEVRQQRNDDAWDPEDIRYNTFRWITAEAGFAMGPSRTNPLTGQILDADIIFDASFLRYWKTDWETFSSDKVARLMDSGLVPDEDRLPAAFRDLLRPKREHVVGPVGRADVAQHVGHGPGGRCRLCEGMHQQMGFAAAALFAQGATSATGELPEQFVQQALKEVVMHEVGHTLGLRHNFKASTWKPLEKISDPAHPATEATVASVMDYIPANIAPKGARQGLYYTPTIGPYDYWAIEYGYRQISGDEKAELAKIASRSAEPGLDFATDEDTRGFDPDPLVNRFDLGSDPVAYAARQGKLVQELMPELLRRVPRDGDGYQRLRQAFGMLFGEYWRSAGYASRLPGGLTVVRDHKGTPNGRPPFSVVPPQRQRDALALLSKTAFAAPGYPPELLNHLAATRWSHWGMPNYSRLDYPIHDFVAMMQTRILAQLLSPITLSRLHDNELKVAPDADRYALAEHLRLVADGVFTELNRKSEPAEFSDRKPFVPSFRRDLQRNAAKWLGALVVDGGGAPDDARALARMHLALLDKRISTLLEDKQLKLDDSSAAHLMDVQNRIRQVLDSKLEVRSIN